MSDPTVVSPAPTNAQDETRSVVKAAGLIGVATFSSRILGFVRDMVLARIFGATPAADAFFVAYRVPNLLRELFAEGSMSSAFIPVFTEYQTLKSKRDAWELASAVFTTLLTIVTGITILGMIVASGIVWLLAPGFHDDPAKLGMTTLLTQIMFPYLVFISLAALAMGILNSLRAFAAPAFSPVFFNIFIIGCALFLSPMMAEPILGVAIGVVAGGAAQFAMQLPGLSLRGMLFGFRFKPSHPGVRRIGALMVPSLLGLSVTQINITVSTILASFFAGGPTYLFYGMRLIQFPLGIFGVALATAILPTLSAQAARGALDELRTTLGFGLRMILFIILPAMLGLILLRQPIVHLFFEHGTFTAHDTAETAAGGALLFRRPLGLRRRPHHCLGLLFAARHANAGHLCGNRRRSQPRLLVPADVVSRRGRPGPGHSPGGDGQWRHLGRGAAPPVRRRGMGLCGTIVAACAARIRAVGCGLCLGGGGAGLDASR